MLRLADRPHPGASPASGEKAQSSAMSSLQTDDRAHHRRRFSGRDPDEEHRVATPLELLYDLTIVVAFGTAAERAGPLRRRRPRRRGRRRVRVRLVRGELGVAGLLVVRVGLRHRRLGLPAGDDGPDDRRDRPLARPAAGVRVDRPRRRAGHRRGGRGLRDHARGARIPVVGGLAPRSRAGAGRAQVHRLRGRRADRLGRARDRLLSRSARRSR